ncbi:hypothetical protein FOWG_18119 [Fusarium oxysporum f. sp. lycopersici MN25]|nr:hypothetical protein FOWG_18119 [Fusarium oxysporum f. sp. lycopersici MN25]
MSLPGLGLAFPMNLNQPLRLLGLVNLSPVVVDVNTLVLTCVTDGHSILPDSHAVLQNRET